MRNLTDMTFNDATNGETALLVDFWADWCGPCKVIAPFLEQIGSERTGSLEVAKVDVDDNQALAQRLGIQSIPTLVFFKDGVEVARLIGAHPKSAIDKLVDAHL